jgi:hypothetical protein
VDGEGKGARPQSLRTWTLGIFSKWRRFSVRTAYPCSMAAAAMSRSLNGSVFPLAASWPWIYPTR